MNKKAIKADSLHERTAKETALADKYAALAEIEVFKQQLTNKKTESMSNLVSYQPHKDLLLY